LKNKQYKGFYNIVKNEAKREATILIYGVIGGFDWDSYSFINTSDKFVQEFKEVEAVADIIHIKINSPGGNVHDGLPIYNTIKNSKKTIYTYVDGIAYSMAALIALAGDKVYGNKNSLFMVHNASTYFFGNAQDIREEADVLDKYDSSLGSIIEDKLNLTEDQVKEKHLNYKDNYFTGKEALAEGFFDELLKTSGSGSNDVPTDIKNMSQKDVLDHYAKMNFEEAPKKVTPPQKQPAKTNKMNTSLKNIEAVLDATFEADQTKEGILLNEQESTKLDAHLGTLVTDLETAKDAEATAKQSVTDMETANTSIIDEINTSLELEGDAKVTDVAGAIAAMKNKIEDLGEQPGETHTNLGADGKLIPENSQMDFNTPFYNKTKKLLN
tara:strand:+ start:2648 stop:3796 length:1149 start_codon:yes stop_codon:yes gene_type:complete